MFSTARTGDPSCGAGCPRPHPSAGLSSSSKLGNEGIVSCNVLSNPTNPSSRYSGDSFRAPGAQQGVLRQAWSPAAPSQEFYHSANGRIFSFLVSRHPFERILSAYR